MNLTSLTVLGESFVRVSDINGRYASYSYNRLGFNLAELAQHHANEYSARQLRVQRTRQRVILRILHDMQPLAEAATQVPGVTGSGTYITRNFLLNSSGVINRLGERFISGKPTDQSLVSDIASALLRVRAFGARGDRRLAMQVSKPAKFKRLWKDAYHSRDMGAFNSECSFDDAMDGIKMGVELEFARVDEGVEGDDAYMYMASDGSLPSEGAEFITRPDSWKVHVKELGDFLTTNRGKLGVSQRCGMHVHVDRNSLSARALELIIMRMYAPGQSAFQRGRWERYERIAGREQNNYWSLRDNDPYSHFEAVNRSNRRTIEFRMFSGTSKIAKIKRRLQWVATICAWANGKAALSGTRRAAEPEQRRSYLTGDTLPIGYPLDRCECSNCVEIWTNHQPVMSSQTEV